jgi:hypothetical protein
VAVATLEVVSLLAAFAGREASASLTFVVFLPEREQEVGLSAGRVGREEKGEERRGGKGVGLVPVILE